MRSCFPRWRVFWLPGALLVAAVLLGQAAPVNSSDLPATVAAQEREACIKNLKQIYAAIQAYELDHKDLPNWLSDLVPQYLADANVLVCPVCRRTGRIESAPLADPNISTSYLFEFCPMPLGDPGGHTRRDWKRRQMGLVGSAVPIVRCRHHNPVLNLAFDGTVYESPPMWEHGLTNRINAADLTAARLFAHEPAGKNASKPPVILQFAPRDPKTPPELVDLSPFYNAMLTQSWHGGKGNDLAELPTGVQTFAGVQFDVRGIVQLRSSSDSSTNFPAEVKGIPVGLKCRQLHFLHAAGFGAVADEGKQIGLYVVHFTANQTRLEIPIIYGQAVRNWHELTGEPAGDPELKVGWTGQNAVSKKAGRNLRLFITSWTNLVPDAEVQSLDFISSLAKPAPFLIAITAE